RDGLPPILGFVRRGGGGRIPPSRPHSAGADPLRQRLRLIVVAPPRVRSALARAGFGGPGLVFLRRRRRGALEANSRVRSALDCHAEIGVGHYSPNYPNNPSIVFSPEHLVTKSIHPIIR